MNEDKNFELQQGNGVLPLVSGSTFKGYWVICVSSYEVNGIEIPRGRMDYHTSIRPIVNTAWRRATQEEVDTRQYYKGNAFNLRNV